MKALLLVFLQAVLLGWIIPSPALYAQSLPADFNLEVTTGGPSPSDDKATITIDSAGNGTYTRYMTGGQPAILADTTFKVSATGLQQLWKAIQDSSFFTLNPVTNDSTVQDGEFARIVVTGNGTTHDVVIRNSAVPRLQGIIDAVNAVVPPPSRLQYTPPPNYNVVPRDPCNSAPGTMGMKPYDGSGREKLTDPKARAWRGPTATAAIAGLPSPPAHSGTVVACTMSLEEAIAEGIATVSSKGQFDGDAISVTVDNTHPVSCTTCSITLFLEFWGPLATPANVQAIEADILSKWGGLKTSDGEPVEVSFVTLTDPSATSPPFTPGFHEIDLLSNGRSHCTGNAGPNQGIDICDWRVGGTAGLYGHEAGHLLGLPDRYVDYHKRKNGSWSVNPPDTGPVEPNDDAMAQFIAQKWPGTDVNALKPILKKMKTYSIPDDGSENDLMGGNNSMSVIQADIDAICSHHGLLVLIPAGLVYPDRNGSNQNLIGTHSDDLLVPRGQKRTLGGIYAACIDHSKGIPDSLDVFDVTPPVAQWQGFTSAGAMARLIHYIDSAGLYCGNMFAPQEAIWRISDNSKVIAGTSVDLLLQAAGVNLGDQITDFPHLTGSPSQDAQSHRFIPNELFVANIRPRFVSGQVGSATGFIASVSAPQGVSMANTFSWEATGPDQRQVTIAGTDSAASLTPARSGIYAVGLKFSVTDSAFGLREFDSNQKAYLIVPDAFTETFEHTNLTDKFPWKSYGNNPWKLSSTNAETGTFSAQPNNQASGQSSTLGIDVQVPADTVITFSVRSASPSFIDLLTFSVDSTRADFFYGAADWKIAAEFVRAGHHRLTWTAQSNDPNVPGNEFWVDNVFFPGNVVVASVGGSNGESVPKVFELDQNYPNPFNPTTVIRYGLPHASHVTLALYNSLGQRVVVLVDGPAEAGYHEVQFNGSNLASGVYFCRLQAGSFTAVKKLILVR